MDTDVRLCADSAEFQDFLPEHEPKLPRYHRKPVREWLVKLEQRMAPCVRYLQQSYDNVRMCSAGLRTMRYHPHYVEAVRHLVERLRVSDGEEEDDDGMVIGSFRGQCSSGATG